MPDGANGFQCIGYVMDLPSVHIMKRAVHALRIMHIVLVACWLAFVVEAVHVIPGYVRGQQRDCVFALIINNFLHAGTALLPGV